MVGAMPDLLWHVDDVTLSGESPLWLLVALVTALSSLAGLVFFDDASGSTIAFVLAFAAGAILTMLADTMMPEAFDHGGKLSPGRDPAGTDSVRCMDPRPTLEQLRQAPKVLLHDHLDGGLRPATVIELAAESGYRNGSTYRQRTHMSELVRVPLSCSPRIILMADR
jgi:hypothetical protein